MSVLWGAMSPQMLQKISALALEDIESARAKRFDDRALHKLGSLGSWGIYSNNVWRDLKARLPAMKLPFGHWVDLPMRHNVLGDITHPLIHSLCVFRMLHCICLRP
jgi:hypothetical protein